MSGPGEVMYSGSSNQRSDCDVSCQSERANSLAHCTVAFFFFLFFFSPLFSPQTPTAWPDYGDGFPTEPIRTRPASGPPRYRRRRLSVEQL